MEGVLKPGCLQNPNDAAVSSCWNRRHTQRGESTSTQRSRHSGLAPSAPADTPHARRSENVHKRQRPQGRPQRTESGNGLISRYLANHGCLGLSVDQLSSHTDVNIAKRSTATAEQHQENKPDVDEAGDKTWLI